MFFLAISLISTFFLGNDPNEVLTSHRWRLLGGPYLGYCTWRRRVSGRQLVFFFCERAAIFFMDTGEGAGDAGAAAVQNRVESHATSGVSPLGAWPCWSPWCSWQLRGWWHLFLQVGFAVKFPLVLMVMVLDFSAVGWLVSWVFESQLASFINHSWASYFIQEKLQLTFVDLWFQSFSISSWFSNPFGFLSERWLCLRWHLRWAGRLRAGPPGGRRGRRVVRDGGAAPAELRGAEGLCGQGTREGRAETWNMTKFERYDLIWWYFLKCLVVDSYQHM